MPTNPTDAPIAHRYDIAYFFEVTDGNPNGDPDAGNLPRLDPETNHGLVTDVCLKRKVRNYVALKHGGKPPQAIYVSEKAVLNNEHNLAWEAVSPQTPRPQRDRLPKDAEKARALTAWMCQNFYDIRTFGAVMTTEVNCGQVRGPIQFTLARSVHPVLTQEHAVTRCAVTNERDQEKERTMGRKFTLPYGLYRGSIFISPLLADLARSGTGFSDADLALFKEALSGMFDHDRSAARGTMAPVACFAFRHEHPMGQARADQLMARIRCEPSAEIKAGRPPRSKADFTITCDERDLPSGVTVERWI
jgi:CRISPR-associated protein Csd2